MPEGDKTTLLFNLVQGPDDRSLEAEKLIDGGADVNARDEYEQTPVYYALMKGHRNTVAVLCRYGATLAPQVVDTKVSAQPAKTLSEWTAAGASLIATSVFNRQINPGKRTTAEDKVISSPLPEVTGVDKLLSSCLDVIQGLSKDIEQLGQSNAATQQSLDEAVAEYQAEILRLRTQLQAADVDAKVLAGKHDDDESVLRAFVDELQDENGRLEAALQEAEDALALAADAPIAVQAPSPASSSDVSAEIEELEGEIETLRAELDEAKRARQKLGHRADSVESRASSLEESLNEAEEALSEKSDELSKVRQENNRLSALLALFIKHHYPDGEDGDAEQLIHALDPGALRVMLDASRRGPGM